MSPVVTCGTIEIAMEQKILEYSQLQDIGEQLRQDHKKIVLVSGCFDLPHLGHVTFFEDAKSRGDMLVVALGPDNIIKQLKGPRRPIMDQQYRAQMLAAFAVVDFVIIADEPLSMPGAVHFEKLVSILKPDFFAINEFNSGIAEKKALIEKYGGQLAVIAGKPVTSTTEIISKIESIF